MFQWVLNKHLSSESGNKNTSWLVSNGEIYRAVNKKLPVVKRTTSNARLWTQAPFKAYLRFFLLVNCSLWCCDYYYLSCLVICTAQKMKLSVKEFFSKYEQILRKLRIWSHLLKKSLLENFIFLLNGRRRGSFPLSNNYSEDVFALKDFLGLEKT